MSSELKKKELKMRILKAEAAKAELEYKIEERRSDIKRMEDHMELQDKIIAETTSQLNQLQ